MARSLAPGLVIFGLFLASLVTLHGDFLALAIPFAAYLVFGFWRSPENVQVVLARHLSADRAAPGAPVEVKLTLINRGALIEELRLEDFVPAGLTVRGGSPRSLVTVSPGVSHTWSYTVEGPRGGYAFGPLQAVASGHLAVTRRKVRVEAAGRFYVFPRLTRLQHVAIRPRRTRVYAGMIPARAGGTGVEFYGVRAYQSGDPPRRINWRASARHADLYTNEFQQERVADVGIVLDGRLRTNMFDRRSSLFEHSVSAAAALADAFITQGDHVGLLLYGAYLEWTLPGYGKLQRERILQALANARLGDSMVFTALKYIPARLFPPESQLVIVSPLIDDDFEPLVKLRAQGYQVLVVSPDPIAFEVAHMQDDPAVRLAERVIRLERRMLLKRLQRAGVQVLDWNVTQPFDQLVRQRLGRVPAALHALRRRA